MNKTFTNLEDTIQMLEGRISDNLAQKINKVCLFDINNEQWLVDFTKNTDRIKKGTVDAPACTISVPNMDDWFAIINGELNPTSAYMQGKVKIKGDISTALKMQQILSNK